MHAAVATWSTKRRIEAAINKCLNHEWTQSEAARHYGVNRANLNRRVQALKKKRLAEDEAAALEMAAGKHSVWVQEKRNVGTFPEFFDNYFGSWICPDCQVHHDLPDFHHEIIDALESDARRVLVNLPPYHSKSTLITVWHTVYDLARNPNSRTILVSKSAPFAKSFLHSIKDILSVHELYEGSRRNLIEDWGPFKPDSGSWSEYEIYVEGRTGAEKDPSVLSLGYGGQIYGRRADRIKFDDIATLENQRNPDRVANMIEWINKEALSRIGKSGQAVWAGTRVAPGDIYYHLGKRGGYKVIRYPALIDDTFEEVLWPEHFPYSQVLTHRGEMSPIDFQLVYQNVDVPGLGASFEPEAIDLCKDVNRVVGHYETGWRLIAGIDPAGGTKNSGYTALTLLAIDLDTGMRYLVDQISEKSMKAPGLKQAIYEWTERYPIYEWRVESNGLQSQLVQYNEEIIQHLAKRGVRVVPHQTNKNKWDDEFGVESTAPLFATQMISLPWAGVTSTTQLQPFIEELVAFPMGRTSDRVMSFWFAELGCRDLMKRAHLPLFNERQRKRWPKRIRARAKVANFEDREIRSVSLEDQRVGHLSRGQQGYRRMTVGTPTLHGKVLEFEPEEPEVPTNVDFDRIWRPKSV